MVIGQKFLQDRRLTAWSVCAHNDRQQVNARFVYEDDGPVFFDGLFFNAGQRSSFQRWISVSWRCLARRIGFWGVQPRALRIRLTCAGWYCTPNSRWMTWATREQVHSSPRNPKLSAPRSNNSGSFSRSTWLKRNGAPDLGRSWSVASPPSLPRLTHWLTAPLVTPMASAISFCSQPAWYKAHARLRRSRWNRWHDGPPLRWTLLGTEARRASVPLPAETQFPRGGARGGVRRVVQYAPRRLHLSLVRHQFPA